MVLTKLALLIYVQVLFSSWKTAEKAGIMPAQKVWVGYEMSENYRMKKIGVKALCRISAKGGNGVYLYIPKNFAEVYSIVGADYAEVVFGKIFYEIDRAAFKGSKTVDLRSRSKKENVKDPNDAAVAKGEKENTKEAENDFAKGSL